MSYYKSNDASVLAAVDNYMADQDALFTAGKAFAARFGGKPIVVQSLTCLSFAGVKFKPRKDSPLWTKPDRDSSAQRPRSKVATGATPEQKDELKALLAEWAKHFPKLRVELDTLYKSFGSDWGQLLFGGIGFFLGTDGFMYVETSAKLGPHMQEILGSEYMLAKEALNASTQQQEQAA